MDGQKKQIVTGQLGFREYGDVPDGSGRKLGCFFGNGAVPEGHGFKGEHLHAFCDVSALPEHIRASLAAIEAELGLKVLLSIRNVLNRFLMSMLGEQQLTNCLRLLSGGAKCSIVFAFQISPRLAHLSFWRESENQSG
jgi:hypothetical protein